MTAFCCRTTTKSGRLSCSTSRRSCVARLSNGSYIVTPDNGTLTYIKERFGITAVREIDESVNRLRGSEDVHIFHGRDVYAYCGARLAAGIIDFEGVGPEYPVEEVVEAEYIKPAKKPGEVSGMITFSVGISCLSEK